MPFCGASISRRSVVCSFQQFALLSVVLASCPSAFAQPASTSKASTVGKSTGVPVKPLNWQDAIKLIGVNGDPARTEQIENSLRAALRSEQRNEVMACGLVLTYLQRGDLKGVNNALSGIRTVFPNPSDETKSFIARARLWSWLSTDEPQAAAFADRTFREIVTDTYRLAVPKSDLRANAKMIGTVCSMLKPSLADAPIPEPALAVAEKCLLEPKLIDVRAYFKASQHRAAVRTMELEKVLQRVMSLDASLVAEEQANRKSQLAALGFEFKDTRELLVEIVRNAREVSRQNKNDQKKLGNLVKSLEFQWQMPTAGHPGERPIEPTKRNKENIHVRETETVYEKVGNEEKRKTVDRSTSDMNAERDEKYAKLMAEYPQAKADFDRRIVIYVPLLQSWIKTDQERREKLQADRIAALARNEELIEQTKRLKAEASDVISDFSDQRSDVQLMAEQYELTEIAMQSLQNNCVHRAFRPPNFVLIDIEEEKSQLVSRSKR